jgi:PAS domain S-box-containing protein
MKSWSSNVGGTVDRTFSTGGRYRAIFEYSPDACVIMDPGWMIREVNAAAAIMLNAPRERLSGESLSTFVAPDALSKILDRFAGSLGDRAPHRFEVVLQPLEGDSLLAALDIIPLIYSDGSLEGLCCILRDITRTKNLETWLLDSRSLYISLYENNHFAMLQIDPGTARIVDANVAACAFYGYSRTELSGMKISEIWLLPEGRPSEALESAESTQGTHSHGKHRIAGGEIRDVEIYTGPITVRGRRLLYSIVHDVTDRKREREALLNSEEKFRSLTQAAADAIVSSDQNGAIVFWNEAAEIMFGYTEEESLGKPVGMLMPSQFREAHSAGLQQLLKDGRRSRDHQVLSLRGLRKSGEEFPLELTLSPWQSRGETFYTGIIRDVTAAVRADDEIRKLTTAVAHSPSAVVIIGIDGEVEYVNRKFTELTGYTSDEVVGRNWGVLRAGDGPEREKQLLWANVRSGGEWTFELLNRRKDGESFWESTTISPVRDRDGAVTQYIAIMEDISDRKRIREERESAAELIQKTIDEMTDPIIVVGTDYEVKFMNKAARRPSLQNRTETAPMKCHSICWGRDVPCEGPSTPCPMTAAKRTLRPVTLTHKITDRKGQVRLFEVFAAPILREDGTVLGIMESNRDVTEQKLLEEELIKARKLESLGILAGGIAHDFNNILAAVVGNLDLARVFRSRPEKAFERVDLAQKAAWRAKDLTMQLLTFSQGGSPVKKTASILELIRESAAFALSGSRAVVEFSLADDLRPVEMDQGQMSQVINNLIINADQAMPNGGTIRLVAKPYTVTADSTIPLPEGNYVKVSVEDEGTGIPPENLARIFDPYFTTKAKGTGLGLATTYSIVKNHGGMIAAESSAGVGTAFHIYLPASSERVPAGMRRNASSMTGNGKILVMDDEPELRELIREMLEALGYEAVCVSDGAEAVEEFGRAAASPSPFACAIMDLTIPGRMGGLEALPQILEIQPNFRAVVASGYSNDPAVADFEKYGFKGILPKPFTTEELGMVLNEVLEKSPPVQ